MTMEGTFDGITVIDLLEVGRIIPVTPGDAIEIVGDVEMEGDFCLRQMSDHEGLCLQTEYVNANTSSRIFHREGHTATTGFSSIHVGSANPTLGGTAFTLAGNTFYFIRHDGSETGVTVWSVPRNSNNITFTGTLTATTGTFDPLVLVKGTGESARIETDAEDGDYGYLRLRSADSYYDIAVKTSELGGAIQFRPAGGVAVASISTTGGLTATTGTFSGLVLANLGLKVTGVTQLGDGGTTDYTEFEADGTMVFNGAATVWDDLRIVPGAFSFPGTADPTLEDWQPGGSGATYKVYKFKKDDEVGASCQMPHDYKEGSDVSFHIHWTPADRGNEETTALVGWKVDYSWTNIDGTFAASATVDLSDACQSTDHDHLMTPDQTVSGTGKTISSILMLRIYRSDTGADDTWAGTTGAQSPALLEFDIHYEKDTVGSRTISAK